MFVDDVQLAMYAKGSESKMIFPCFVEFFKRGQPYKQRLLTATSPAAELAISDTLPQPSGGEAQIDDRSETMDMFSGRPFLSI